MSTSAIAIAAGMKKLQDMVDAGEFSPEDIADTLEAEALTLGDKFDGILSLIRNLEGQARTLDDEIKRLTERKRVFQDKAKNLRAYLLRTLQAGGYKTFKTDLNTLTVRQGAVSVVIDDESLLPDDLVDVVTTVSPDKKKIKQALEAGKEVRGAHLETGEETLQVR
ncbi:siphovirus Gp157 family protein [Cronobacter sakazakii]|nr:siphovirus Gp157 family protein [Cronobacter sakazakii]